MPNFDYEMDASHRWNPEENKLHIEKTLDLPDQITDATISLSGGNLTIRGASERRSRLMTELTLSGSTEADTEGRFQEKQTRSGLEISVSDTSLVIDGGSEREIDERRPEFPELAFPDIREDADPDDPFEPTLTRTVDITLSNGRKVEIATDTADVTVENFEGEGMVISRYGSIGLQNVDGEVKLYNNDGHISGDDLKGNIVSRTENGDIILRDVAGTVHADSLLGSVLLEGELTGENLALSAFGDVEVTLQNERIQLEVKGQAEKIAISGEADFTTIHEETYSGPGRRRMKFVLGYLGDSPQTDNYLGISTIDGSVTINRPSEEE